MDFESVKTELEKAGKSELTAAIAELIQAERQKGIEEVGKRNKEAQNLRKYKKALESAGLTEEDNLEDFIKNKMKPSKEEESLTLKSLKAELDRVKQERDAERLSSKKKSIQSELTNALGDKLYGSKYLINNLINDGTFDVIDGEMVYKNGDEHLSFNDGVTKVLNDNKDMLKTNMNGGAGSKKPDAKLSSLDNILKSGDRNAIKANFAEIAQELGLKV